MKILQTYHHVILHSTYIHNEYIVNAPLDVDEMYNFTKKRLANLTGRMEITFRDTISDNPGCPNVISLNTYASTLNAINENTSNTINKKL